MVNNNCQELFLTAEIIKNDDFQPYCQYIVKQAGKVSWCIISSTYA